MKYTTRIHIIKVILNTQGILAIITMFLYMIPIAISYKTGIYDMYVIVELFLIAMATYSIYLFCLNKYLTKYNSISDMDVYKNHIKEMIYLLTTLGKGNTKIDISILFFIAVLITYTVWWWKADVYIIEGALEYLILVAGATINGSMIIKYIRNFNVFVKRLYKEVYK